MRNLIALTLLFAPLIPAAELFQPVAANAAVYDSATATIVRQKNTDEIGDLLLNWKESGLTAGEQMSYSVSISTAVTYRCPDGSTVSGTAAFTGSALAIANKRGIASAQLLLEEPASPDPTCTTLCNVNYPSIQVDDGNLSFSYPDATGNYCQ